VTGVGQGQVLGVRWPDVGWNRGIDISTRPSVPPGLRPKRIAELEREVTELEYVEEALVVQALARGQSVERRSDAPAAAILGVRVLTKRAAPRRRSRSFGSRTACTHKSFGNSLAADTVRSGDFLTPSPPPE
jgi:hypothetical protein